MTIKFTGIFLGISKIHVRRCLHLSHSQKQNQKDSIGLSYLSLLYFINLLIYNLCIFKIYFEYITWKTKEKKIAVPMILKLKKSQIKIIHLAQNSVYGSQQYSICTHKICFLLKEIQPPHFCNCISCATDPHHLPSFQQQTTLQCRSGKRQGTTFASLSSA